MKKIIMSLIISIMLLPIIAYADTCNDDLITIKSIEIEQKTDTLTELSEPAVTGKNIDLNLKMSELGDYIEYKLVIKNDSEEDYLFNNNLNTNSSYITYTFTSADSTNTIPANGTKTMYLKVTFTNGNFNITLN